MTFSFRSTTTTERLSNQPGFRTCRPPLGAVRRADLFPAAQPRILEIWKRDVSRRNRDLPGHQPGPGRFARLLDRIQSAFEASVPARGNLDHRTRNWSPVRSLNSTDLGLWLL